MCRLLPWFDIRRLFRLAGCPLFVLLACLPTLALAAAADADRVDVRVIIDISGSMKQTDPNNLRIPALNLVVELLPNGAQAGVWTFGRYVNMLVPLAAVNDDWRLRARAASQQINSAGQRTNLTEALDKASWKIATDNGYQQSVILLTDGVIDVARGGPDAAANVASRQRLLQQVLPTFKQAGVRIHTLALSDAADKALLQQIALETDGLFLQPQNADDLTRHFLRAFERSAPAEQVPLNDNRFSIDASVKEFTALIFRKPGGQTTRLISPSGKVYDANTRTAELRWHRDVKFDLLTLTAPESGEWQVEAELDPENRVQILSDLKLQVEGIDATIFSGDPLDIAIALNNEGNMVTAGALLGLTDFTLTVTTPDGRSGSKLISDPESLPDDGIFRETLERFRAPGEYRFEIQAQGRTFSRKRVMSASLAEPFVVSRNEDTAGQVLTIKVAATSELVDTGLSRVLVRSVNPDGSSKITSMSFNSERQSWELPAMATEGSGIYQYELNIRGVTTGGKTFRSQPEIFQVRYPLGQASAPVNAPLVDQPITQVPVAPAAPAPVPEEKPNAEPEPLQARAEVATPVAKPPVEMPATAKAESKETSTTDDNNKPSSSGLWLAIVAGVVGCLLMGGLTWWFLRRKKSAVVAAKPEGASSSLDDDDAAEAENIKNMDDFEAFMSEGEEQIVGEDDILSDKDNPVSLAGDTDIDPLTAAQADENIGELDDNDDWGEFDTDDDNKN
jgi:uncharacterized protein (TIGR03503 family)